MDVRSPKDGFVVATPIDDGKPVSFGQHILTFDSMDEDKQHEKIEKMELMRQAHMAQYQGPALAVSREILGFAISIADQEVQFAERRLQVEESKGKLGAGGTGPAPAVLIADATSKLDMAKLKMSKAEDDLKKFNFSVSRALDMAEAAEHYFAFEKRQLGERIERLKIPAPIAGKLVLLCGVGSFAKHGNVVARIESWGCR